MFNCTQFWSNLVLPVKIQGSIHNNRYPRIWSPKKIVFLNFFVCFKIYCGNIIIHLNFFEESTFSYSIVFGWSQYITSVMCHNRQYHIDQLINKLLRSFVLLFITLLTRTISFSNKICGYFALERNRKEG